MLANKFCEHLLDRNIVWWECKLTDGDKEREEGFIGVAFLAKEVNYFLTIDVVLGFLFLDKMKVVSQSYFLLHK